MVEAPSLCLPEKRFLYGDLEFCPKIVSPLHVKGEYVLVNVLDIFSERK